MPSGTAEMKEDEKECRAHMFARQALQDGLVVKQIYSTLALAPFLQAVDDEVKHLAGLYKGPMDNEFWRGSVPDDAPWDELVGSNFVYPGRLGPPVCHDITQAGTPMMSLLDPS